MFMMYFVQPENYFTKLVNRNFALVGLPNLIFLFLIENLTKRILNLSNKKIHITGASTNPKNLELHG